MSHWPSRVKKPECSLIVGGPLAVRFDSATGQLYHPRGMGQPHRRAAKIRAFWPFLAAVACVLTACDAKPLAGPATRPAGVTVASLVPAATDLILSMGAGNRLVAVSNYDTIESTAHPLPRVGDYQTTDWETLASLHPSVMLIEPSGS